MTPKSNCPFCPPLIDQRIIYEDPLSYVILTRDAINAGQSLVIPKRHAKTVEDLTLEEVSSLHTLAKRVADIFINKLSYDGVNILMNSGAAAGQTINHSHIHVVPRRSGDVSVAREWLSPELQEIEYSPGHSETKYYSDIIRSELIKS